MVLQILYRSSNHILSTDVNPSIGAN